MTASGFGRVGGAGGCPTVGAGIISAAGICLDKRSNFSAPDDHFAAGPDCRVAVPGSGRVNAAGCCPTIGDGIISAAGVEKVGDKIRRPRRSFHCSVHTAVCPFLAVGRVSGAGGGRPTVGAGIISVRRCSDS